MLKNQILVLRGKLNMSLSELSRLSGISRTQLWRIENGHSEPTFRTMVKISKDLKYDLWDVFLKN